MSLPSPQQLSELPILLAQRKLYKEIAKEWGCTANEIAVALHKLADADLLTQCARARETAAALRLEDIGDVINEIRTGEMPPDVGRVVLNGMQWVAMKTAPKSLGEKVELTGKDGGPIQHEVTKIERVVIDANTTGSVSAEK